jgi:hypothetical protein
MTELNILNVATMLGYINPRMKLIRSEGWLCSDNYIPYCCFLSKYDGLLHADIGSVFDELFSWTEKQ